MRKLQHAAPYLLLFLFSLFCLWSLSALMDRSPDGNLGPAFWPRMVLVLMAALCLFQATRHLLIARDTALEERARPETAERQAITAPGDLADEPSRPLQPALLIGGLVLIALYAVGIQALGFFVSSALFLSLFAAVGGFRHWLWNPLIGGLGSFLFLVVFMRIAYISLPLGAGPFKELSLLLMHWIGVR